MLREASHGGWALFRIMATASTQSSCEFLHTAVQLVLKDNIQVIVETVHSLDLSDSRKTAETFRAPISNVLVL